MTKITQVACILLMTVGLASVAQGQIASSVDDHGNVIFINAEPPRSAAAKPDAKAGNPPAGGLAKAPAPITASKDAADKPQPQAANPASTAVPAPADNAGGPTALAAAATKAGDVPTAYDRVIEESAEKNHVDPALVRAVISTESNWNSSAVSSKGAQGLMQLVPQTAQQLGVSNAFDPRENIDAGVRYLSTLLSRYNGDLNKALAAYNAGPAAVDRFGGVPNYRETRDYVQKVTSTYFRPESPRQPRAYDEPVPIYRTTDESGRVIFVNE